MHRAGNLDEDLARFHYLDGDLFRDLILIPFFDAATRELLLEACQFDWSTSSPAIFGSVFQSVMDRNQRRAQGAHYTTEKNILKVIEPLFLDDLHAQFDRAKARKDKGCHATLRAFHKRLGNLTLFDAACGCDNFLIIAYRELRALEIEVIRELRAWTTAAGQRELDVAGLSRIDVDRFYGIEIGAFPARIAEAALWMMDRLMNSRLSLEFGESYSCIPLQTSSCIVHGDAVETDRASVLPPQDCPYLLGNPPFLGAKYQTPAQRSQARGIAKLGGSGGTLDYVAGWFFKAAEYAMAGAVRVGFVATNSDYPGGAGRAAVASAGRASQRGDFLRAPHVRVGLGRAWEGPRACGDHRPGRPANQGQETAVPVRGHRRRAARELASSAVAVPV